MMNAVPDRATFEAMYSRNAPWDIGRPQKPFVESVDQIGKTVLDAGCGTGDTAIFLASKGRNVTGVDFLDEAINRAKRKATELNVDVDFQVKDALTLNEWERRFESVIDSGLFHVFSDENRKTYATGLANVLKPGGKLFLMCFSDAEPGTDGPRRVSKRELEETFADGWTIESLQPRQFEIRPDFKEMAFSEGGPMCWFAVICRKP